MSVLAIINTQNGSATKSGLEAASYAAGLAAQLGTDAVGIVAGPLSSADAIGTTGITAPCTTKAPFRTAANGPSSPQQQRMPPEPRISSADTTISGGLWPLVLPFD